MPQYGKASSAGVKFRAGPYSKHEQAQDGDADVACMVYVGSLPYSVRWQDLKDHMSQAGQVEFARVFTEDNTSLGKTKGTGIVRYETPAEARRAIATLKDSTIVGDPKNPKASRQILVDAWTGHASAGMKTEGVQGLELRGDPATLIYVGNLSFKVRWQELKDHMAQAGTVEFCKVLTDGKSGWGRSKGKGCIRYATAAEANTAIASLNESALGGRNLVVDHWTRTEGKGNGKGKKWSR